MLIGLGASTRANTKYKRGLVVRVDRTSGLERGNCVAYECVIRRIHLGR